MMCATGDGVESPHRTDAGKCGKGMGTHPGGRAETLRLIGRSGMRSGKILDMGCGSGESVCILLERGFEALGIDLCPGDGNEEHNLLSMDCGLRIKGYLSQKEDISLMKSAALIAGDFLKSPFPDMSFDGIIAQCSFFVSGDEAGAFREAERLLKPGGILLVSDVVFEKGKHPKELARDSGFEVGDISDDTALWREYYLEKVWQGDECSLPDIAKSLGKCGYYSMICKKGGD